MGESAFVADLALTDPLCVAALQSAGHAQPLVRAALDPRLHALILLRHSYVLKHAAQEAPGSYRRQH
jgi:hypothetical protein